MNSLTHLLSVFFGFVLVILITSFSWGQIYLPPAFDMSAGAQYTLNAYNQINSTYPPNMAIRFCSSCQNIGNFVTDLNLEADHQAGEGAGKWRGENDFGVSVRGGGNQTRASFLLRLNTTNRSSVRIRWTVRDIATNPNTNFIELQWRIGAVGNWNNITGDLYQQGTTPNASNYDITLPAQVDNQSDLRIRWIYYESATGARDRLAIDDIIVSADALLPIQIQDFNITTVSNYLLVNWTASHLESIDRFILEESINGLDFYEINSWQIDGTLNFHDFNYRMYSPMGQIYYYRLRQVELDGSTYFTPILSIDLTKNTNAPFYPSLVDQYLNSKSEENKTIEIIDINGKVWFKGSICLENPLYLGNITTGVYFIKDHSNLKQTFTFLKA